MDKAVFVPASGGGVKMCEPGARGQLIDSSLGEGARVSHILCYYAGSGISFQSTFTNTTTASWHVWDVDVAKAWTAVGTLKHCRCLLQCKLHPANSAASLCVHVLFTCRPYMCRIWQPPAAVLRQLLASHLTTWHQHQPLVQAARSVLLYHTVITHSAHDMLLWLYS